MTKVSWGTAKIAVYLLKDEVLALYSEGATIEETYKKLSPRLDVSYRTFRRYAAAIRKAAPQSFVTVPAPASPKPTLPKLSKANPAPGGKTPPASTAASGPATPAFDLDAQATDEKLW